MQPAFAIPPLTEDGVKNLIGCRAGYPVKNKRTDNPASFWWGEITHVRFVNEQEAMVWIVCSHGKGGNPRWHRLSECRFSTHCFEPLKVAIHRARLQVKEMWIV